METKYILEKIVDEAKRVGGAFYKISLIQNGVSETATLNRANGAQNSYSIAKAYTVTAIGMLYDRNIITMNEKVCDIFRDELPKNIDPAWEEMTVHNLMKHMGGFNYGYLDIDEKDHYEIAGDDYLKYLFETKLEFVPNTECRYSDAAFYLLSRIFSKKTGEMMDEPTPKS